MTADSLVKLLPLATACKFNVSTQDHVCIIFMVLSITIVCNTINISKVNKIETPDKNKML